MKIQLSAAALAVLSVYSSAPSFAADAEAPVVVVTATRQETRADELLADVSVVSRDEIAAAGQTTLAELLSSLPGIQMTSTGGPGQTSGVFIRGANSEHTLVLVDGVRIGSATSGAAALERIPLDQIERIEILRGPASALYGADAIGGVVQIFTRRGNGPARVEAFVGGGSWNTQEVAAGVSGGDQVWSYALRGGYASTDGISATNRKNFAFEPDRDTFRNGSVSASLAFRPAEGQELGATVLRTEGRSRYDEGVPGYSPYNDVAQAVYSLYARNRLTDRWTSTVRIGRSEDTYRNFSPYNLTVDNTVEIKTTQDQLVWQNDVRLPVGSLLVAFETLRQEGRNEGNFDKARRINSALVGWSGRFDAHSLQVNLRRDDNSQFGGKTSGALAYGYQLSPELRVQGSVGTAFRAPSLNDLYYPLQCFGVFGCFGGNPNLKPERAVNRDLGLVWDTGRRRASVTVYDNRVSDLIVWGNTPENVARARLRGVTLADEGRIGLYDLSSTIDWLDAKDADTDQRLLRRAEWQGKFRLSRTLDAWTLGGEWQLVGRRYNRANEVGPMGGYGLVNLFARYALAPEWTLEARANNVTDKKYESALGFNTPGANVFVGLRYAPK